MFWFASISIWDQPLNYSLPEKSWNTSRTQELQNQTSQTHTGDTWHPLFVKVHSTNIYHTDDFASTSNY